MKKVFLVLTLISISSWAALPWEPEFSWTFPTEYESGAPITVDQITETRIYCDGNSTPEAVVTAPAASWTAAFKGFGPGSHTCYATVVDIEGAESGPSNSVNFTVPADRARAPGLNVN